MGRSRTGWIAAVAALAFLAALAATCEPAAEVRPPPAVDAAGSPEAKGVPRPARARARRDGGLPEGADAPGAQEPDGRAAEAVGTVPPPATAEPERKVTVRPTPGRVVDSSNDAPVSGARVLLAVFADGSEFASGTWGDRSGAGGRFDVGPREVTTYPGDRAEVIVVAPGYHLARVPAEPDVVVRLEPRRGPEPLGAVTGTILDAQGAPSPGVHQLGCTDITSDWKGVWTLAGTDGSFRAEGFAPGPWRIAAGEGQPRVECLVPSGGEARVTLTAAVGGRRHAELLDEELRRRLLAIPIEIKGHRFVAGTDEGRAAVERLQIELQELRWEELCRRPVRRVAIEGLPADAMLVRARRPGTSQGWSARPASGRAEFTALYTTEWDLEVERFAVPVAVRRIDVPAGTETLVVRWSAAE